MKNEAVALNSPQTLRALFYPNVDFKTLYIPYIYKEIYLEGVYLDVLNGLKMDRSGKDKVILDIGANIGCTTQEFKEYGKVFSVEPDPTNFEALKKNKEFNHWDRVEIFNLAIADKDGEMFLSSCPDNRTCQSLVNNYGKGGSTVKTQTLNTFFKKNNITEVDFCKLDVEGAEEMILCSPGFADVAPKIKSMMVEFHFPSFPKIVDHLIDLGFKARRYPSSAVVFMFDR